MTTYYAIAAAVIGAVLLAYDWYRRALARQTAQDAATLATYRLGHSHRSAECAAPYDHAKAAQAHQRQTRRAAHVRAKSRKVQDTIAAVPVKAAMRRVK